MPEDKPKRPRRSRAEHEAFAQEVREVKKSRQKQDLKDLIQLVMESPVNSSDPNFVQADGNLSIEALASMNKDGQTAVIVNLIQLAARGNVKAAELLFKYGGYTPPKEVEMKVVPTFINNLEEFQDYLDEESEDSDDDDESDE